MIRLVVVVACFAATASASAQGLPEIDPMALCRRQADMIRQGDWMLKACLDQEQQAYDSLKDAWPTLDAKTKSVCTRQSKAIRQGYWLLHACVEQELEAKKQVQDFRFKK